MIWKNVSANAQTCNATVGLNGQSPDPQNEAIGTKFWHLVVNTSQTPYERSIINNRTPILLVKTSYRLLGHLLGLSWGQPQFRAPLDSPLGDRPTVDHDAVSTRLQAAFPPRLSSSSSVSDDIDPASGLVPTFQAPCSSLAILGPSSGPTASGSSPGPATSRPLLDQRR
ncbi:hypothetical protein M9H77_32321 [Catharanthus roseus]|uniref:Uncharacterized protein n=1 Tax=Catharanthus roseus TaxID=4058 RepID=A0ACC0A2X7_CATRO|nr:hypothetical protein M9H77_32321 [Catharanthus roseus]